jgi:integrase
VAWPSPWPSSLCASAASSSARRKCSGPVTWCSIRPANLSGTAVTSAQAHRRTLSSGKAALISARRGVRAVRSGRRSRASGDLSTRYLQIARASLARAVRYAEAHDLVGRNVATLVDPAKGQVGRPSRSLTLDQSLALLEASRASRLNAYVVLSLTVGIRTEEARGLLWDHVDLDGDPGATRPVPPSVAVWRSVRQGGDTKTAKSRRTLALPQTAVQALREHRKWQVEDRLAAGALWQDHGLVFVSAIGTPPDAANVRREFRKITEAAGLGTGWAPRDLRHTFVSLMSRTASPSRKLPAWPGTTGPQQQNSSTATSCAPSSLEVPRSWTGAWVRRVDGSLHSSHGRSAGIAPPSGKSLL